MVMANQLLYIFQNKCFRFLTINNSGDIKKKCPANITKPMHLTNDTKWLTWKSGKKHIMVRNVIFINFSYVSSRSVSKICLITVLKKLIYIRRKNAFRKKMVLYTSLIHGDSKATN